MKIKQTKSVYIIQNLDLNRIKIGHSVNPIERMRTLSFQSGCKMELLYSSYPIYNFLAVEMGAHKHFEDERIVGEWFKCSKLKAMSFIESVIQDHNICKIVKLHEEGKNSTEIGVIYGVSRSCIVSFLRKRGVYNPKKRKPNFKKHKEDAEKLPVYSSTSGLALLDISEMVKKNNEKIKDKRSK